MRNTPDSLTRVDPVEVIAAEPWRHDFFHTMRWVEAYHANHPRLGTARKPADEPVRLGQAADLSFAPSTLHSVTPATAKSKPRIDVRFFGLFGPNGPLPYHLTEYARHRAMHQGDSSFARFADMFHHRLLLLFYRAWAQAQPTVGLDRPDGDRFAAYVGSLIGLGVPEVLQRDAVHDHAKLHFAGIFSRQVRNADGLAAILAGYLRRPVKVEQFAGSWLGLPASERTRIGRAVSKKHSPTATLGGGAVLGGMVWDRQHNFRVHIGPLDREVFESLLPGGSALSAVKALIEQYAGMEFGWDLRLSLKPDQVRPSQPGRFGRLGWTSWLGMEGRTKIAALSLLPRVTGSIGKRATV
jgi:type VI secretion system protein ImpH